MYLPLLCHKTILIGVDLIPAHGGIFKSVNQFSQIFKPLTISFTRASLLKQANADFDTNFNIMHVPCPPHFLGNLYNLPHKKTLKSIEKEAANAEFLICHSFFRYSVNWTYYLHKKYNIPYWFVTHGALDPYVFTYRSKVKKIWYQVFGKRFLENASCVIFSTEPEKAKASHIYSGNNTHIIHWPIDFIPIKSQERATRRTEMRDSLGIPQNAHVLIYFGRLHPSKRILETIKTVARLKNPNLHLIVLGPEETISIEACKQIATAEQLYNIHLIGPVYGNKKYDYLAAADGYISLSFKENFNYTAAESLSIGLPVILSPGNDLSFKLKSENCGWMLQDESPETAVQSIRNFCNTPIETLQAMGNRGQQWAHKNLSFDSFSTELKNLLNTTIQSPIRVKYENTFCK